MGLNKYDALHIFTILWLSTVSISLISLSIRHEQTDQRVQKSLDALAHQNNNNPFIPDVGLDIDRNNERDSVKVEVVEKSHVNSEPMNDIEDEKISVDVKEQDLVQEAEGIIISSSPSRHKEKPANFESALNAFSDELERYESSKRKKRVLDTAFHRQLNSFDVDSREHRDKSRASIQIQGGRQRETSSRSLSEKVEHKDKQEMRSHYRKASHISTDLTLLKLDNLQQNEKFMKERALQKNKKSIEAIENGHIRNRRMESRKTENNLYHTSCVVTKAEIFCGDIYRPLFCRRWASKGDCTNTTFIPNTDITYQDRMLEYCRKSCNTCPILPPLENQVHHEEIENIISTFDISMNVVTDGYARDTSWLLFDDSVIFNSNETIATSQLVNNEHHLIQYNCIISQNEEREDQLNDKKKPICYHFEVHDLSGDGICCKYGDGSFSMSLDTNAATLKIEDNFIDGYLMSTSFCIKNHDDGKIHSNGRFITKEHPSHYPFRWQCKNEVCLCDSKPSLTTDIQENLVFMFEVTMLSGSDKLRDVESAQYKAACWVLYDDPYKHYDLEDEGAHKRMMQRYILAVFYFSTSPEKWMEHFNFLSLRSECDWRSRWVGSIEIECDSNGNIIKVDLGYNYLGGTIVDELSGLGMLEELHLGSNNIRGTIPAVFGRLTQLRYLNLGENKLEGTIPPELFNATNLEELLLWYNRLEGTIPETIGNLQKLSWLDLKFNNLSGSIPDTIYSLKNLELLSLYENKLSSSISPLIGNLNKLEWLSLYNNMLTGQIPSTIGRLTSLKRLHLNNNTLSGSIPESLFDLLWLEYIFLQDNSVTGSVPHAFCERSNDDDNDYPKVVEADCRNDVFDPEVSCTCCRRCTDKSPIWDDDCIDTTINVVIDHEDFGSITSQFLKWSLVNDATGKKILYDGPYSWTEESKTYEACVAYSDCFSINQISPPYLNTNYTIYWNDESIYNGTFRGYRDNGDINWDDPPQLMLSFQYDKENQNLTSCGDIEYMCDKEQTISLRPNTTQRIMYNQAIKISGKEIVNNPSSPQSKALCWMLQNNTHGKKTYTSDTEFEQRYILAILHFMSPDHLFGDDKYPPNTHECDWNGINCTNNSSKIVTDISISSNIINGRLIDEIGSLKYLEVLEMKNTQLYGTIPRSFSNLWSLRKLDLSNNTVSNTIPTTLFRQLNKLEYIDLSDNSLSGTINEDIGSYSHIRSLLLRNNSLTGPFPLDTFNHTDLEHLDISDNKMSSIDFSLLLKHKNLKTLDLSNNFFVGSLLENTFTTLTELKSFDISQNDISGTIPSTFPELSNITHLDMHRNRLKGPIPLDVVKLINIQHLNLQGNQLTGSLPNEINQLKSLKTLVLSHNELKGSIPFDNAALQKLDLLHLHNNKLSGEAPKFSNITSFITDCGHPSDSLEPVSCSSCNTCCNSDGTCQSKSTEKFSQVHRTLIFIFTIIGFVIICYTLKNIITTNKHLKPFFSNTVNDWNPLILISDKSIYHFFLIEKKISWCVAFSCCMFQSATLLLFVHSTDMVNETSDREYSMVCPSNSLKCETNNRVSSYGTFIFSTILAVWLLRDMIGSVKLMLLSFEKKNIDFFFTSAVVFSVTALSLWTSIIYIDAIAVKNTDMIKDAVILLFVLEMDERLFQLVESMNPDLVKDIESYMDDSVDYEANNLMISSMIEEFNEWKKC